MGGEGSGHVICQLLSHTPRMIAVGGHDDSVQILMFPQTPKKHNDPLSLLNYCEPKTLNLILIIIYIIIY